MVKLPSSTGATAGEGGAGQGLRYELADVVRACGEQYLRTYPSSGEQRRVLRAIAACRTAALGGHVEQCEDCSYRRISYNSCLMGSLRLWRAQPVRGRCTGHLNGARSASTHHKIW